VATPTCAFGLTLRPEFPLPGGRPPIETDTPAGATVRLARADPDRLFALTGEARFLRHLVAYEGCPFATLEGAAGDLLFHFWPRALFHLKAGHRRLNCAFIRPGDRLSQRVLLDTVLWTTSLHLGFELLHASAVATDHGIVAFVADQGGGKTTLAAEFLRRDGALFADDIVALESTGDAVLAHPGPTVMNLPIAIDPADLAGAEPLATFGDERWIALPAVPQPPREVAAIVLVRRADGATLRCHRIPATTLSLLPFATTLPHMTARGRRRFEVFGALADATPVLELAADLQTPPATLADAVDRQLDRL
jgi:hypothetical protein